MGRSVEASTHAAVWEQSVAFLAVLAAKVEQCSTFEAEAEAEAAANQILRMQICQYKR